MRLNIWINIVKVDGKVCSRISEAVYTLKIFESYRINSKADIFHKVNAIRKDFKPFENLDNCEFLLYDSNIFEV